MNARRMMDVATARPSVSVQKVCGVRSSSQSDGLADGVMEHWKALSAKHTQRTSRIGTAVHGMGIAKALRLRGSLCHRYAVPPSWYRRVVGLPWVSPTATAVPALRA